MGETLSIMGEVARKAGGMQMARLCDAHSIEYKGVINLVTEVDRACEKYIVGELSRRIPGCEFLAEEGTAAPEGSASRSAGDAPKPRFIVDPLDGTVNYAHGFPFFCVSIALEERGELTAGVIFDPNRNELFEAKKGGGAFMNGSPISVSNAGSLRKSLLATGFAYNVQEGEALDNLDNFCAFIKRARAVRRPGSAAIDLAWVACGRIDGFWELFLKPWDMAAGVAIIREAGGMVTSFDGGPYNLYGTEILASNGAIHREMIGVLGGREGGKAT
ncbi:MAG TPA: inositol monophosphatase family protein [bacterium]|nr:inositol monophosphatase family protein [bacterium]